MDAVRARSVLSAALCLAISQTGHAAHPFITDDAGTQGAGQWQLELLGERSWNDRAAIVTGVPVEQRSRTTSLNPVLTYGVLDTVDIALGFNSSRYRTLENGVVAAAASGASDTTLELKWRFYEKGAFNLAVKPGLSLPTGDEDRGLGTGRMGLSVNLIADYATGPWVLLANLAYTRERFALPQDQVANRRDLWRASAGVAYAVVKELKVVGELGVRSNPLRDDPYLPGRDGWFGMLGAIWSPTEKMDFDVGLRKRLNRAEADTVFLVGATFRW